MQGLVLQLSRAGFLLLLWLFIFSVLRILRTDIYAPTEAAIDVAGRQTAGFRCTTSRCHRPARNNGIVVGELVRDGLINVLRREDPRLPRP